MRNLWLTAAFSAFFLISDLPVSGQYPGGGYPPGTYPGRYPSGPRLPIPRRSKQKKEDKTTSQQQLQELKGVLRQIDDKGLTITSSDSRTITAKRSNATKFYSKGEEAAASVLKPGDHIRIEATQDEEGFFYAVSVYVDTEGTASERAAAAQSAAAP